MGLMSVLSFAQKMVTERLRPGDVAIDATIGNGVDTLFLARTVGPHGTVYGFDIQAEALMRTNQRFTDHRTEDLCTDVRLVHAGHEQMTLHVEDGHHGEVATVMFNLGYLPAGEQQQIITKAETTLPALESALTLLRAGGIVCIVLYPGHEGGLQEATEVERWACTLSSLQYDVLSYRMLNRRTHPPYLIVIEKKRASIDRNESGSAPEAFFAAD
jgi:predicted methyltransferase